MGIRKGAAAVTATAALLVTAMALAPAAASGDATPHLNRVAAFLRQRAPGTEGRVWWRSSGNTLPGGWLLQTPDCWGRLSCSEPPPGGSAILTRITQLVADARRSVDLADLYPAPDGRFRDAIIAGLRQAIQHGYRPQVRVLVGTYPGHPFSRPDGYVSELSDAVGGTLPIQAAYMSTNRELGVAATSWDHSKVLDVDGRRAIVGGMNYWTGDYLNTNHPVNDISMQVQGPAAADVSKFEDVLWSWTCAHRDDPRFVYFAEHGLGGRCVSDTPTLSPPTGGEVHILTVGRLGDGIPVPGGAGRRSPPIPKTPLRGNKCAFFQRDYSQTNDDRAYEYRNPGEDALRALISSASESIFVSQQDLLSCLPKPLIATEALFDERVFAALATKIGDRVPITIVLSNGGAGGSAGYSNGWSLKDAADALTDAVVAQRHISRSSARDMVCRDVRLAGLRNGPGQRWADGHPFSNHAKLVEVDDQAFYIGSENLYPARLQELGMITESRRATSTLMTEYLDPMWRWSRGDALIDPARRKCGRF